MENLGKYLHDLRQEKGIEYSRIFEDIRLREDQIKLIENNRLFDLGPHGVVKAMVFNYARYLEADTGAVLAELRVLMPEAIQRHNQPAKQKKTKRIMLSTNFLWGIGILFFVLILTAIVVYSYNRGWLQTPDIFTASAADTTVAMPEEEIEKAEVKPDSTRMKMRELTQEINAKPAQNKNPDKSKASRDTTDYINTLFGDSPLNVPIR